jgi:hypothetical protein
LKSINVFHDYEHIAFVENRRIKNKIHFKRIIFDGGKTDSRLNSKPDQEIGDDKSRIFSQWPRNKYIDKDKQPTKMTTPPK